MLTLHGYSIIIVFSFGVKFIKYIIVIVVFDNLMKKSLYLVKKLRRKTSLINK